jgi:predicted RNA-binding Zn-ribbon protein involved in translation (DUF1610 family)
MPIYNFSCSAGHVCEKIIKWVESLTPGPCPECGGDLERVYLSRQQEAQRFKPIVIDVSPEGEFSFPMNEHAPVSLGFARRELRTFAEADAVMRSVNEKERRTMEAEVQGRTAQLDAMNAENRRELRERMRHMSPAGRAFADYVMAQNDAKARPRMSDPGVFLEIRERDGSNREAYSDSRTNWKRRKG